MQVNVIQNGSPELFRALIFPEQSQENIQYFYNQMHAVKQNLTACGQQFQQAARQLYQDIGNSHAMQLARAAVRMMHTPSDGFRSLNSINDVRVAPAAMQSYMMAHTGIREMYHRQLCDGYSGTYVDPEPNYKEFDHTLWRNAMSGVIQEDKDDNWKAVTYFQDNGDSGRKLDYLDRHLIQHAWAYIDYACKTDRDPTDVFGDD